MLSDLAPAALFVYNRPEHTRQTVEALARNTEAAATRLYVFSDAPRTSDDQPDVQAVRDYLRSIVGFLHVEIVERGTNYGLARNIVDGVTEVCNSYGRVIVLEDDIVTSPYFLAFMNVALGRYAEEKSVWHISGWNYPVDPNELGDAFLWRVMNCWGWATWVDRWKHFQKNPQRLIESWDKEKIRRFNLDGAQDFWAQVTANDKGRLNTWAVFWYATIFENNGLCLNPGRSFVHNIGLDGSGENCGASDLFRAGQLGKEFNDLPERKEESSLAVGRIKAFCSAMRPTFSQRVIRRVMNQFRSKKPENGR